MGAGDTVLIHTPSSWKARVRTVPSIKGIHQWWALMRMSAICWRGRCQVATILRRCKFPRTFLLHPKTVIFQVVFNFIVIGQPNFGTGHCPSLIAWPSRFYNPSGYLIVLTVYSSLPLCRLLAPSAEINKPVWLVSVFSTETVEDLVSDLAASVTASVSSYSVLYCTTPSIDVLNFPPLSGVILPLALTSCRLCVFRQLCQRDRTWME